MNYHFLHDFLYPNSIAFYGANNKGTGIASFQVINLILSKYRGKVFPIHLNLDSVMGYKAYRSISELPEVPDLVIIYLPPKIVPEIFRECGEKGVKRIIIVSGGFREMIGDRKNIYTEQISQIAEKYGIRFIGPNCLGFYNNWIYPEDDTVALNTSIWEKLKRGKFSIASQSGTLSSHIWFDPEYIDMGLSRSLSIGNEANIDIVDCLEYLKEDDKTEVIGLYIEEIKRGKRFFELATEISPNKPIIAIYLGGTEAAERAVRSHTGSIAGNSKIYSAVFKKAGIIKTELVEEFLDIAMVLSKGVLPKGRRVGVITNSGGPGAMIANHAEKVGLKIPEFSESLQVKLKSMTSHTASTRNPLDSTFDMNLINYYINLPKAVMKSGEVDLIFMYGVFGYHDVLGKYLNNERIAHSIDMTQEFLKIKGNLEDILIRPTLKLSKRLSIPIIYINPENYSSPWSISIKECGGTLFQFWDRPVRVMAKICEYAAYKQKNSIGN